MVKWLVELREFDIQFQSRQIVKAHILADFLVKVGPNIEGDETSQTEVWILHVDDSSTTSRDGTEIFLQGPNHIEFEVALKLDFKVTNNEAKYKAPIA